MSLLDIAVEHVRAGIGLLPIRRDGSKAPASGHLPCDAAGTHSWRPLQERLPTVDELVRWFDHVRLGIGVIAGRISLGLEIFDFDDGRLFEPWCRSVGRIVCKLPVVETPSGGYHVYLRCDQYGGNVKIAVDLRAKKQTLIETRGQGGYVISPGSPSGVHQLGLYVQVSGPPLPKVPRISPDERRELWAAARRFDKRIAVPQSSRAPVDPCDTHPVVAAFNSRMSWDDILSPLGWTTRDNVHWTRPGKSHGASASIVIGTDNSELLTVFSANAGPLSPNGLHRTWSKFAAWAAAVHGGDWKAAIREAGQKMGVGQWSC